MRSAHSALLLVGLVARCSCFSSTARPAVGAACRRMLSPRGADNSVPVEKLTPMYDQVLVDVQSMPSSTEAGILLPTAFQDDETFDQFITPKARLGTVLAVGPGAIASNGSPMPMPDFTVGQKVVVGPSAGNRLQAEGKSVQESTTFLFHADEIWGTC